MTLPLGRVSFRHRLPEGEPLHWLLRDGWQAWRNGLPCNGERPLQITAIHLTAPQLMKASQQQQQQQSPPPPKARLRV